MKTWLCAFLLLYSGTLYGQPVPNDNTPIPVERSQYTIDLWSTAGGLPSNQVKSLYQTTDGYIWATTYHGLARFDGTTWVSFDNESTQGWEIDDVISLCEMKSGDLWVSGTGDVPYSIWSILESDRSRAQKISDKAQKMVCLGNGAAIIHDEKGLTIHGDSVFTIPNTVTISGHPLKDALFDSENRIWLTFPDKLFRYDAAKEELAEFDESSKLKRGAWQQGAQVYDESISMLYRDAEGRMFFVSDPRIQLFEEGVFKSALPPGLYMLQLVGRNSSQVMPIIKSGSGQH